MSAELALTWWGHASTTVELGGVRVVTDPIFCDRLAHLRRYAPTPSPSAYDADVVVVSHLHHDHLHLPTLRAIPPRATLVVPPGARALLRGLPHEVLEARPGMRLEVGVGETTVRLDVLAATHDGRRHHLAKPGGQAVGYRVSASGRSFWFPGDSELRADMAAVAPVDLALAPVGGWGPTLDSGHMGPEDAATAVARVGASWAVPVHWGTFWPVGLARLVPANHQRLFVEPGGRFETAAGSLPGTTVVLPEHGRRVVL